MALPPGKDQSRSIKEEGVMLNVKALTITGAIVAAASYVVCAGFVAIAPDAASTIGTYIVHIDLSRIGRTVSWGGAALGGTFFTAFVALVCATAGTVYNSLATAKPVSN